MDLVTALLPSGPLPKTDAPLYRQLAAILRNAITEGLVEVGSLLPTEHALSDRFGVSRVTVRQALQLLSADGYIRRRPAKGTEVVARTPGHGAGWNIGTLEDIVAFGSKTRLRIDSYRPERAPEIQARLGIPSEEHCYVLRGARLLDGEVFGITAIHLPPAIGSQLKRKDFDAASIFPTLQRKLGIALVGAEQEVSAELATAPLARGLGCRAGAAILAVRRLYLSEGDRPVEYAVSHYRGSVFSLKHRLRHVGRGN